MCVTVSGYTLKWASTSETRSKWYAMKGATVAKTMQYRFQITNMTELRERESTGGSSYSGKEGLKRCPSLPAFLPLLPPLPTTIPLTPSSCFLSISFFSLSPSLPFSHEVPFSVSYLISPNHAMRYHTLPHLTNN